MARDQHRPKVLVVDDEADVLRSVHDLLRRSYEVVTRQDGEQALEVLRREPDVAVVLSDQRMPGMSGVELLRQARSIRPESTRLLFTAFTDIRAVVDAINEGHVFRYVTKPWEPGDLEAALRQAVERHDLLVEKARLVADLKASNERLHEANRLKNAFLEVASHELNTPVTVIMGLTNLWKMKMEGQASPTERQWVDRIDAAAARLAKSVRRMLDLIETRSFGRPLDVQPVDLEQVAAEALESLAPYLEARNQRVEVHGHPAANRVEGDPPKLVDILINLVANAIKFTPDGGVIRVRFADAADPDGWTRVVVEDQGIGIQPGEQPYLFEPFFTGFDTLHHSSGDYQFCKRGMGLGLCLVKAFVELHGGRVEFSSHPGQGSSFGFVMPRRQAAGSPDDRVVIPRESRRSSLPRGEDPPGDSRRDDPK
ncbi:hybrid sensor histidine kinase/response regulator [Aquisphaera insulae]|uniref:hybrid sensor histidine kinase/response regulator n=1 Tax=Aquisphaera insulae TaxID=2712864 RepID=UPI0013EB015F|nr:hybrid sensor histidine kinase/response regulator [Aquisphaera insulae]